MKRKVIVGIIICIIIMGIGITKIFQKDNNINVVMKKNNKSNIEEVTNVKFIILDNTLTKTSATIVIEDMNREPYKYEEWFRIDKKENGIWKAMTCINDEYYWKEMAYNVGEDKKLKMKQDWLDLYGKLENGEYRLVKRIYDGQYKYFWTEFDIS